MKDDELPTMDDLELVYVKDKINNILLAHEAHAKEMIRQLQEKLFNADKSSWRDEEAIAEWRGYLKAILELKGQSPISMDKPAEKVDIHNRLFSTPQVSKSPQQKWRTAKLFEKGEVKK